MMRIHIFRLQAVLLALWLVVPAGVMMTDDGQCGVYAQATDAPKGSTAYYELNIRSDFKAGEWEKGKGLLDEALEKYPQMSAFHELMGKYLLHKTEKRADNYKDKTGMTLTQIYDKARYHLIRAINIDEKNVQARFLMLRLETETKHYSSAIVYCNDLLEENPYNEDLWRKKIDLYRKLGNNAEADKLLERIQTIYPGDDDLRKDYVERKTTLAKKQREVGDVNGQEQSLRSILEVDPRSVETYRALANLLYQSGRVAEAAEVAGKGAAVTGSIELVEKRAGMLCELNRHREAIEYIKAYAKKTQSRSLAALAQQMDIDAAREAQYNDAYIYFAKIYEAQHSLEALDYLVNTSIERWYLDDALMYVEESLKRRGETPKMLYNQYIVNKRLGNTRKANSLLEKLYSRYPNDESISEEMMLLKMDNAKDLMDQKQYAEAVPLLEEIYNSKAYAYLREAAVQRLYNCYYQTRQYVKAEALLPHLEGVARVTRTAELYNASGRPQKALDLLVNTYYNLDASDVNDRQLLAYSYEEFAVPYIKQLLADNKVATAQNVIKEAMEICPQSEEILRYAITAAQRKGDSDMLAQCILRGKSMFKDEPYYVIKEAQLLHLAGKHAEALAMLNPLLEEYSGDSVLMAVYADCELELAQHYLKEHNPDKALEALDAAIKCSPDNTELYYYQSLAYEKKKMWDEAYKSYRKYKAGYAELSDYKHRLEELFHHTMKNSLSFEYQQARPGSEDVISGNAYLNYNYIRNARNTFSAGLAYAGRDGAVAESDTEMTKGGTGVQVTGGWEHTFTDKLIGKAELGVANRYFPLIMARLSGTYDLRNDWQLSALVSYRMLRSYAGVYGWHSDIVGYDPVTNNPIMGNPAYIRTGWKESKKSMLQVGVGVSKTIEKFELAGGLSGFMFDKKFYFNSNLKMQFFPKEGNSSHFFATCGAGTAPESSLIDRSMPVGFNKVNTFVGMGGSYFVNRWITLALSGTWYTMLSQSERLTTTYIANDPYIREDYRNYFYVHGSVMISF